MHLILNYMSIPKYLLYKISVISEISGCIYSQTVKSATIDRKIDSIYISCHW